jgi:hypothetical protein
LLLGQSVTIDGPCASPLPHKPAANATPKASVEVSLAIVPSLVVPLRCGAFVG